MGTRKAHFWAVHLSGDLNTYQCLVILEFWKLITPSCFAPLFFVVPFELEVPLSSLSTKLIPIISVLRLPSLNFSLFLCPPNIPYSPGWGGTISWLIHQPKNETLHQMFLLQSCLNTSPVHPGGSVPQDSSGGDWWVSDTTILPLLTTASRIWPLLLNSQLPTRHLQLDVLSQLTVANLNSYSHSQTCPPHCGPHLSAWLTTNPVGAILDTPQPILDTPLALKCSQSVNPTGSALQMSTVFSTSLYPPYNHSTHSGSHYLSPDKPPNSVIALPVSPLPLKIRSPPSQRFLKCKSDHVISLLKTF